jgi:hypothetical protein
MKWQKYPQSLKPLMKGQNCPSPCSLSEIVTKGFYRVRVCEWESLLMRLWSVPIRSRRKRVRIERGKRVRIEGGNEACLFFVSSSSSTFVNHLWRNPQSEFHHLPPHTQKSIFPHPTQSLPFIALYFLHVNIQPSCSSSTHHKFLILSTKRINPTTSTLEF